ncbi:hypothetical protein HispidOSU_014422B, partial [Sigmodon hispidus]
MSQLNLNSPSSSYLAESQHQNSPRHSSGLAVSQPQSLSWNPPNSPITPMEVKFIEPSEEDGYHTGPKRVKVLSATKGFIYNISKKEKMFHATVATENEYFRVLVFNTKLRSMFNRKNPIALQDYFGSNGSLMIHECSSVSMATDSSKMDISEAVQKNASTPKICDLSSQTREMLVNGDFTVSEKRNGKNCIYYVIKDDTGEMKLVVSGLLTNIPCGIGDTVRFVGFELTSSVDEWFLRATRYSYME